MLPQILWAQPMPLQPVGVNLGEEPIAWHALMRRVIACVNSRRNSFGDIPCNLLEGICWQWALYISFFTKDTRRQF